MNNTLVGQIIFWYEQAHEELVKLLEYLRHCYSLEEQCLAVLDDQQFREGRIDGTGLPDETVGHWLMWHLVHDGSI